MLSALLAAFFFTAFFLVAFFFTAFFLVAFLAVFFASLEGLLGLPALSQPYLGASWGQVGLQDRFQDDFLSNK